MYCVTVKRILRHDTRKVYSTNTVDVSLSSFAGSVRAYVNFCDSTIRATNVWIPRNVNNGKNLSRGTARHIFNFHYDGAIKEALSCPDIGGTHFISRLIEHRCVMLRDQFPIHYALKAG